MSCLTDKSHSLPWLRLFGNWVILILSLFVSPALSGQYHSLILKTNGSLHAFGGNSYGQLGWVFPVESPAAGLWLWKEEMGWLWTDEGIYPFLYDNANAAWLYF